MEKYFNRVAERMPEEQIRATQEYHLRQLLEYVWENQLPYRRKMEAIGITPEDIHGLEDIARLPFTDKEDINNNYPFGMQAAKSKDIIRIHATSGTSGTQTIIPCTRADIDLFTEGLCRALVMEDCNSDSVVQNTFSYSMFIGGQGVQYAVEKIGATLVPTSVGNTRRQLRFLKDFQVDTLCCTPSYALHMASVMGKYGYRKEDFKIKNCFLAGERLSPEVAKTLSEAFGAQTFDVYGNAEMTNVFASCRYDTGLHIPEDMIYAEIIDSEGKPVQTGQEGELVITTLQKTGLPLVRYRTHDITKLIDSPCPCGRTGKRIGRIKGRTDEMMTVKGCKIFPSQIESAISQCPFLSGRYLITVNGNDILIQAEALENTEIPLNEGGGILRELLKSTLGVFVNVIVVPYGTINIPDGNKIKTTTQK